MHTYSYIHAYTHIHTWMIVDIDRFSLHFDHAGACKPRAAACWASRGSGLGGSYCGGLGCAAAGHGREKAGAALGGTKSSSAVDGFKRQRRKMGGPGGRGQVAEVKRRAQGADKRGVSIAWLDNKGKINNDFEPYFVSVMELKRKLFLPGEEGYEAVVGRHIWTEVCVNML